MELETSNDVEHRKAFTRYLRTGPIGAPRPGGIEVKFNPYHDPRNGRFTFGPGGGGAGQAWAAPSRKPSANAGKAASSKPAVQSSTSNTWDGGGFTGGGGGSAGGGGATGYWLTDTEAASFRRRHPGMEPDIAETRDNLATVARRHNIRPAALAKINGLSINAKIKPGDILAVPHSATAKRPAQMAKPASQDVASKQEPSKPPYRHVIKHGYDFAIDADDRTRSIDGVLTSNPDQVPNKRAQLEAGKPDRLPKDEGGHYIARRFNGPTDAFNHFAQDGNFNRSSYAKLENRWSRTMSAGNKVRVHIVPTYSGTSKRPRSIIVSFDIGDEEYQINFPNSAGAK